MSPIKTNTYFIFLMMWIGGFNSTVRLPAEMYEGMAAPLFIY